MAAGQGIKRKCGGAAGSGGSATKAAKLQQSVASRASQKLRENFKGVTDSEANLVIDPQSGLSLRQRLE